LPGSFASRTGRGQHHCRVKRASPSKGDICPDLDAVRCAREYAAGGAAAISVLTDTFYFKGCLEDMRQAREAVALPVLRKEFIIATIRFTNRGPPGPMPCC
jgi:indole-3-glycerol phosphate synthase